MLVPSTTPGSPPDQSDGEIDPDETGALKLDDEVVVVSEASDSGGEDEAEEAEEASDDAVDGGSEDEDPGLDGDSELGDEEDGEDGALDVGGHGLVDVPGVPGVPGAVEAQADGALASISLLDGDRLRRGAAPSLPKAYTDAINGAAIGPSAGSCGTAAYRGETVIVEDIATDPLWSAYRDLALSHSLRA